ncbi:hypothetical protein DEO72_LG5g2698 [Vigna unguiculata]|uniref:Uncharacterized protein n=1 Tax=Vigna unguiculata TaxID=3917 RepID=A0A4D6M1G4_VIGUN|nr:hypothetical protein DEO72_LG5g2698 [Vigna unguiculata]
MQERYAGSNLVLQWIWCCNESGSHAFMAVRDGVATTKMLVRGADLWRFVHGVARRCCALQCSGASREDGGAVHERWLLATLTLQCEADGSGRS